MVQGEEKPTVALFVTCLVDLMRPRVGFAAARLLEAAGCRVVVPAAQTCCGQPAYNAGARAAARAVARDVVAAFEGFAHVVVPSGSCAGMIRVHYPRLLADDPAWAGRARALAARSHELTSFLVDVLGQTGGDARLAGPRIEGKVTYHDSCSGLRELGIKAQPRKLLAQVKGLTLAESARAETCCGFGGTFCVKQAEISARMTDEKIDDAAATGAATVLAGDLGCLLAIAGRASRRGVALRARHVAEVLAGMADGPAIGEAANEAAPAAARGRD